MILTEAEHHFELERLAMLLKVQQACAVCCRERQEAGGGEVRVNADTGERLWLCDRCVLEADREPITHG